MAALPVERAGYHAPAWSAGLLAFAASAATLVLELVAGRMLAPYIGVSLYTWTSIIGVVLAGVSLGNWLGGRLADRNASPRVLGTLFMLGGVASVATLVIVPLLGESAPFRAMPLLGRIFALSAAAFLPASLILAMATPVVIRQALLDVRRTGRVVGMVYAAGTAGSLAGNFATGFVLTAYFNVTTIVLATGAAMILLGLIAQGLRLRAPEEIGAGASRPEPNGHAARESLASATAVERRGRGGLLELHGNARLACTVVAVASFATMGIELAASRILAPYLGLSLYSWTGIIGVVLAAITLGNYLGGRIADRWPDQRVLGLSLFVGGMGSLAVLVLVDLLNMPELFASFGLVERIVLETAAVFFLPIMLLGVISPQVTRLAVSDLEHSGRIAGEIYAWSTAGAIVGTFATGWFLVSAVGVHALVFVLGLVLIALALLVGRFWRAPLVLAVLVVAAGGSAWALQARDAIRSRCTVETNYFCIKVGDSTHSGRAVKTLVLDHLVHSYVDPSDPNFLGYVHEQVQAEIAQYMAQQDALQRVLVIGGGGYTYPKWVEANLPQIPVEVVEIDPGVTQVAHDYLALPRDTRIQSFNLDGRQYVQEIAPRGAYGLVVQDAVNDLSVPYHIMTKEYNDEIRALLRPDGVYLLTVIDLFRDGQLLRAAVRTMQQTFPEVQLLSSSPAWEQGGANVWVIAGSRDGLDIERMRQAIGGGMTVEMPRDQLAAYVAEGPQIVLTDEYAPVDNLIAILFRSRG